MEGGGGGGGGGGDEIQWDTGTMALTDQNTTCTNGRCSVSLPFSINTFCHDTHDTGRFSYIRYSISQTGNT